MNSYWILITIPNLPQSYFPRLKIHRNLTSLIQCLFSLINDHKFLSSPIKCLSWLPRQPFVISVARPCWSGAAPVVGALRTLTKAKAGGENYQRDANYLWPVRNFWGRSPSRLRGLAGRPLRTRMVKPSTARSLEGIGFDTTLRRSAAVELRQID